MPEDQPVMRVNRDEDKAFMYVNRYDEKIVRLTDNDAAPSILHVPDFHDGHASLEQAVDQYASMMSTDKNLYILSGDHTESTDKIKFMQKYNIPSKLDINTHYRIKHTLTEEEDKAIYANIMQLEQIGGPDAYLSIIQRENPEMLQTELTKIQNLFQKAQERQIGEKISSLGPEQEKELESMLDEAEIHYTAIYNAFDLYAAEKDSTQFKALNEKHNDRLRFIMDPGNHASVLYRNRMKEELGDKYVDINDLYGTVTLGGEDGLTFQADSNVFMMMKQYDKYLFDVESMRNRQPELMDVSSVGENVDAEFVKEHIEEALNSKSRQRMLYESKGDEVDVLFLHDGIGNIKSGYEDAAMKYANLDDLGVALYAMENVKHQDDIGGKVIACGHLHKNGAGRVAGFEGIYENRNQFAIYSKKDGKLDINNLDIQYQKTDYDEARIMEYYQAELQRLQQLRGNTIDMEQDVDETYQQAA